MGLASRMWPKAAGYSAWYYPCGEDMMRIFDLSQEQVTEIFFATEDKETYPLASDIADRIDALIAADA